MKTETRRITIAPYDKNLKNSTFIENQRKENTKQARGENTKPYPLKERYAENKIQTKAKHKQKQTYCNLVEALNMHCGWHMLFLNGSFWSQFCFWSIKWQFPNEFGLDASHVQIVFKFDSWSDKGYVGCVRIDHIWWSATSKAEAEVYILPNLWVYVEYKS